MDTHAAALTLWTFKPSERTAPKLATEGSLCRPAQEWDGLGKALSMGPFLESQAGSPETPEPMLME